ncbi:MAG: 6,7-dimethyl-8-ribityllumazine synthase [Muribaculaceae bacterium]|nr:6,7-dimethyl-8-ribityllumazine synthase [Muribaculaceae bacterium]
MSTKSNSPLNPFDVPRDMRVAIVRTIWNSHITEALLNGALETLKSAGIDDDMIDTFEVPGAVELTFASAKLVDTGNYDAIIILGCVIRGGTPHFDYVCQSVTQGNAYLNSECDIPIIFGVLTVDNEQDALDRAGGRLGNKGSECAQAALMMYDFVDKVNNN